jgi:hypothetical protein
MVSSTSVILFKVLLVALLFVIAFNLMKALFQFSSGKHSGKQLSHFLGRRVFFSAVVVILLLLAMATGFITPNPRPY